MPRIKSILCSGVGLLICSAAVAQSLPKNHTAQQVVSYREYQQKQWNYNQLPKKSIQYISDPKYIPITDSRISSSKLNLPQVIAPVIKKNFSEPFLHSRNISKPYLQSSRFLKYMWPNQGREQSFENMLSHSL